MTVTLVAALTADGFIARHATDRSFDWTSPEDKAFYVQTIKEIGTVVMGSTTFSTFTRYPKDVRFIIYSRTPETFINPRPEWLDARATDATPESLLAELAKNGTDSVAICGGSSMYSLFMEAGLVNRLLLTVEPIVFGAGVPLFSRAHETPLRLNQVIPLSTQTNVLDYTVV